MSPAVYVKGLIDSFDDEVKQAEAKVEELRERIHATKEALKRELYEFACQAKVDDRVRVEIYSDKVYVAFRAEMMATATFAKDDKQGVIVTVGVTRFVFPPYAYHSTASEYLTDKVISQSVGNLKRQFLHEFSSGMSSYKAKIISQV